VSSVMDLMYVICLVLLVTAALVCAAWVLRSRSVIDRAVGIDALVAVIVNGLAVSAAYLSDGIFLELVLLTVVIGFLGTVSASRYVQRRGQ